MTSQRRAWLPVRALATGATVLAVCVAGTVAYAARAPKAGAVTVTVHPSTVTGTSPAGLVGLSLDASELVRGGLRARFLATYLRTLGRGGVLRVAGNSSDETFWTSTGERPPSWSKGTITPAALQPLAAVAQAAGW